MRILLVSMTWVAVLAATGPARSATISVPADYATVWEALDAAAPGDTVHVGPGTWTDTDTRIVPIGVQNLSATACGFLKAGVTLIGAGRDATILDAGPGTSSLDLGLFFGKGPLGRIVIEDLSITGGGRGVYAVENDSLLMRGCRIEGITSFGAMRVDKLDDAQIEDCEFLRCSTTENRGAAVSLVFLRTVRFESCIFQENFAQGGCLAVNASLHGLLRGCTFEGNQSTTPFNQVVAMGPGNSATVEGCTFVRNTGVDGWGTLHLTGGGQPAGANVRFNTFAFDSSTGSGTGGGLSLTSGAVGIVSHNSFIGCHAAAGAAMSVSTPGPHIITNNVVAHCTGGVALFANNATINSPCNILWNNQGGNYISGFSWDPDPTDIYADPEFCDPANLDLTVRDTSPCLSANNNGCGDIGAFGSGCGPVSIQQLSWGALKAQYHSPEE